MDSVVYQIKVVDMPDEFSEKPRILLLACENDAYPALGMQRLTSSAFVRAIPVRCLGSVNTIWITDTLNRALPHHAHGLQTRYDYQCHFVKGSELVSTRMGKIDDTFKEPEPRNGARADVRGRDRRYPARAATDQRSCCEDR